MKGNAEGAKGLQSGWWCPSHRVGTCETEEIKWQGQSVLLSDVVKFLSETSCEKYNIKL